MTDVAGLVVKVSTKGVDKATDKLNKLTGASKKVSLKTKAMAAAAVAAAVIFTKKSVQANRVFSKSLSDLSAITGATGDQLNYLKAQALDIGATTQLSASQAAEAFKLIASAKPDLLQNSAALNAVTRSAVTLAEAAGTTLPDAAKSLSLALNQFGADATEANRYINVLAAGAKFGSSEIEQTTEALKNFGTTAANSKVSIEQATAAVQVLAKQGQLGAEAGTSLRNIILILNQSIDKQLRPNVVGLTKSLENLRKKNLDSTALTKLFGRENVDAATGVLQNVDALAELQKKLTGTNTAQEQASVKTDNLDGDFKNLSSATEALELAIGKKLNPAIRSAVQNTSDLARSTATMIDSWGDIPDTIDGITKKIDTLSNQLRKAQYGADSFFDSFGFTPRDEKTRTALIKRLGNEIDELREKSAKLRGIKTPRTDLLTDVAKATKFFDDAINGFGDSPKTIEAVSSRLTELRANLKQLQSTAKTTDSSELWFPVTGEKGEKAKQIKAVTQQIKALESQYKKLSETKESGDKSESENVSPTAQLTIKSLKERVALYKVAGVERAKLKAIQDAGSDANKKEKETAAELAAQLYKLQEAQKAATKKVSQQKQSDRFLEEIKKSNLTQLELIDENNKEKQAKLDEYHKKGLIDEQDYVSALISIDQVADKEKLKYKEKSLQDELKLKNQYQEYFNTIGADNEFDKIKGKQEAELNSLEKLHSKGIGSEESYQEKLKKINSKYALDRAKATGDAYGNMADNIGASLGKASNAYKAFAIVQATIATYTGAIEAYKSTAAIPVVGPFLAPVAAAAAVAAGLAKIQQIRSAREQGGNMSAGSAYQMAERGKAEVIVPAGASRARTAAQMRDIMGQNSGGGVKSIVFVNNSSQQMDSSNVQMQQDDEGQLRVIISDHVSRELLNPNSDIAKSRRNSRGLPGF